MSACTRPTLLLTRNCSSHSPSDGSGDDPAGNVLAKSKVSLAWEPLCESSKSSCSFAKPRLPHSASGLRGRISNKYEQIDKRRWESRPVGSHCGAAGPKGELPSCPPVPLNHPRQVACPSLYRGQSYRAARADFPANRAEAAVPQAPPSTTSKSCRAATPTTPHQSPPRWPTSHTSMKPSARCAGCLPRQEPPRC